MFSIFIAEMINSIWMVSILLAANLLTCILRLYYREEFFLQHPIISEAKWLQIFLVTLFIYVIFGPKSSCKLVRRISYNEKSVLTVIFQYYIEVLNFIVSLITMTRMIIDVMLLVPFILIQTIVIVISSAWTLAFVLGFAVWSYCLWLTFTWFIPWIQNSLDDKFSLLPWPWPLSPTQSLDSTWLLMELKLPKSCS